MTELDIVVPVYNESDNIIPFLLSLKKYIKTTFRVLICFDFHEDTTLSAIRKNSAALSEIAINCIQNQGSGPHGAVISGFKAANARAVLVMPADDYENASAVDSMMVELRKGADIVCASRLMPGGSMRNCPLLKNILVRTAGFTLHHFARLPTHDATNGFRLFSKALLDQTIIESTAGFTYSIELLVKAHRIQKRIVETPAHWIERSQGKSRFRVLKWLLPYLRWYVYAFETTYLFRGRKLIRNFTGNHNGKEI